MQAASVPDNTDNVDVDSSNLNRAIEIIRQADKRQIKEILKILDM